MNLNQHMDAEDAAIVLYETRRAEAIERIDDFTLEAESHILGDYDFTQDLIAAHPDTVMRLALKGAGRSDLLPGDYDDSQSILDDSAVRVYTQAWIDDETNQMIENYARGEE